LPASHKSDLRAAWSPLEMGPEPKGAEPPASLALGQPGDPGEPFWIDSAFGNWPTFLGPEALSVAILL
jgi:hypothetical protein